MLQVRHVGAQGLPRRAARYARLTVLPAPILHPPLIPSHAIRLFAIQPTDSIPPLGPEAEAAWVCETCTGEEAVGGTDLCAVCPRRGGLMLPSNDQRHVRWAHAFCSVHNAPTVFAAGRSPVLPEMAAVDVRGVTRDLKKFKCGICGRQGVRGLRVVLYCGRV